MSKRPIAPVLTALLKSMDRLDKGSAAVPLRELRDMKAAVGAARRDIAAAKKIDAALSAYDAATKERR